MKWLVYLLAFYVLLLSGIPCSASDDCCNDETTAAASHKAPAGSDHRPASPCSPFFACNACHGVVMPDTYEFLPQLPPPVKLRFAYIEQSLPDFSPSIWQPPQIV